MDHLKQIIRNIPDFPEPGIEFKDITPLLSDGPGFHSVIDAFRERHAANRIDVVAGIEARGFIFASALAYALGAGTCLIRKPGKLPHTVHRNQYALEYGNDTVEIHTDAFKSGQRVLLVDDVLATGGTLAAAVRLIEEHFDAELIEIDVLIELDALQGRDKIPGRPIYALLHY
jgi:adenine phosphoribosyltransferase